MVNVTIIAMADLNEEIAVLKTEIEGYKSEYNAENNPEVKKDIRKLIITRGDNLTELLRQQTAATAPAPVLTGGVVSYEMVLERVDGSLTRLQDHQGFRNFVKKSADAAGVTGYIQATFNHDMSILFEGDVAKCKSFFDFLKSCRSQGMVGEIKGVQKNIKEDTYYSEFSILISRSRRVVRGRFSDPAYDKLSEYSYADGNDIVATPDQSDGW